MKKLLFLFPVLILAAGFYSGKLIDERAKTLLQKLKLSEDNAKNTIFSDISSSSFYFPGVRELKSVALSDRAVQVEIIGKYVKDFTTTEDFKKRYNKYRESQKPALPEKPQTMAEVKQQNKNDLQKSLDEMKKAKKEATSDMQAMYDETIKMLEEQLKEIDNPDNPMYSAEMDNAMTQNYHAQLEQHKKDIAEWEAKYPKDKPNSLIKTWLKSFLDQSNQIDFNAKTAIDENGRTLFVKQDYEKKDYMWKLGFRAGKETTEAAREFAQSWLSELK